MGRYRRLTAGDRCQIYALNKQGCGQERIAAHLGFSQSSISRELARNRGCRGYRHQQAQSKAEARQAVRARPRKLTKALRRQIEIKLRTARWSPEQISGWLARRGTALSHEWIYQMIWQNKRDGGDLWQSLRRRSKRYNKRAGKTAGRGLIPHRTDISDRPKMVYRKARVGDWEGDTVVGAAHKGGLLTLVERKTQLTKIALLPRTTAVATRKAAVRKLKAISDHVHTITFDNGKEFADHQTMAAALTADIFFATPYHAWERALNENTSSATSSQRAPTSLQ